MIEFKKISDTPLNKIVSLVNEVFADYVIPVKWDVLSFQLDVKENSISLEDSFLMIVDGEIVGFSINAIRLPRGRIDAFGVKKYFRERGVGGALLLYSLDQLKWKGVKEVILEVAAGDRAAKFYDKYGFVVRRTLRSFYTDKIMSAPLYKFERATIGEIYEEAIENEKSWRRPNWQREAMTLKLSDDRYDHDFVIENGQRKGYVVWGVNENGAFIIDAAPKNKDEFNQFFVNLLASIQEKARVSNMLLMNVPEDDPLHDAAMAAEMRPFILQWEMSKI
ncbi:GNAT family N-acetyltransferase [Athalassotoga saccharophila]|uniref:GNAT family N-acetyltransferase n=1 Tax=Athalassotoga saccharophila TaxID=1441386 RepID=UPI00137A16EC|nr:GNAT family N-acetyltransferase [Athalassotoga saccharophila]BBJ27508.1 GCN5-related N-acetyltransferase [Athalassotoga saccharophila]